MKANQKLIPIWSSYFVAVLFLCGTRVQALTFDGSGHYSLRGESRTNQGMSKSRGLHQAIEQSFRLMGEARLNDKGSTFLEFKIFEDPENAYLGDQARLAPGCSDGSEGSDCDGIHQNVIAPKYEYTSPKITKFFARYAFDMFLLEVGRRGRDWGMGLFLDSGERPFAKDASIYDGIAFEVNTQKYQTIGFKLGYDKISETGSYIRHSVQEEKNFGFGPGNKFDDVDQLFLALYYKDKPSNESGVHKHIGLYGARINSDEVSKGGSETDLTIVDLFTCFEIGSFNFKNELLLNLGKTADPNISVFGGAYENSENGEVAINKFNTGGFAGQLAWTLASTGSYSGPKIYKKGDLQQHIAFFDYAYAPGDEDGYYDDERSLEVNTANTDAKFIARSTRKRSQNAKALSFHKNFQPSLIMFNGRTQINDLAVDGIFDPGRLMNAQVYSLGYRYENLNLGNIEIKLIHGLLNKNLTNVEIKNYYEANVSETRPFGYYGKEIGTEIDVKYLYSYGKDIDFGVSLAALKPGKAWKTLAETDPENSYLMQTQLSLNF